MAAFIAHVDVVGKHWEKMKKDAKEGGEFHGMSPACFDKDRLKEKWKLLKRYPNSITCPNMKELFFQIEARTPKKAKTTTTPSVLVPQAPPMELACPLVSPASSFVSNKPSAAPFSVRVPLKNPYRKEPKHGRPPKTKKYPPACVSFPSYYKGTCKVCKKKFGKGTLIHNVGNTESPIWAHKKCNIELVE